MQRHKKLSVKIPTLANTALLALMVFLGFHAWQNISTLMTAPAKTTAVTYPVDSINPTPVASDKPLSAYRAIWERNLFNVQVDASRRPKPKIAPRKVARAEKDFGLKLVGTVMADDPALRFAIVGDLRNGHQKHYNEGQKIGDVQIKKILRNRVVIATAQGERLLTIDFEEPGRKGNASPLPRSLSARNAPSPRRTRPLSQLINPPRIELEREEVEAALADTRQVLEELDPTPYTFASAPRGFRIGELASDSILAKMGLRDREVILGINDKSIRDVDQAADFLNTLADGGEITIKVRRRARTRKINLNIF